MQPGDKPARHATAGAVGVSRSKNSRNEIVTGVPDVAAVRGEKLMKSCFLL
jgi:hypothetical protein